MEISNLKDNVAKLYVHKLIDCKYELDSLVDNVWSCACKYEQANGNINYYEINDDIIEISWYETWRYGGYDNGSKDFPTSLLWMTEDELDNYFKTLRDKKNWWWK